MKKVLCFLLCFGLALQLAACAKGGGSGSADGSGAGASGSYDIYVEPDADWTGPVLTIATVGLSNFEAVVSTFNREEDMGFKLRLVDYLTSGSSRESALARLNMDLASGNGPDLIDFEKFFSKGIYTKKGLLLDMSEYFYRDMELKDFYILDKLGADGMYFFPSGLQVITCYGMESVFGGMEGWSIDEYMVMNSQPQYAASPAESQESFLRVMGHSLISNWVDWESMSCSFDDGEFAKLLEFAAGLPQDESLDQTDASRMLEVSGGSLLYDRFWFSSPHQYRDLEREAQAQLSFIGYPTADGSCGSFIYLARLCGVCAGTEYPDEAWEFIKYLISDEDFQNSELFTNIPLRKSVLKAHIDYLLDPYAQYEGKDIVIHEDGTFSVDGEYMDLIYDPSPYLTERQAENIYKLIDSAHIFYEYDPNIQSIVESGAKSFFAGDKSLEACVADIQSRVSLYLAEQSA